MRFRLRVLARAETDALEAARWYEERRPGLGLVFLDQVASATRSIQESPLRFPRLHYDPLVRRLKVRKFPYSVIFEVEKDEIIIVAFAHGRREPKYWSR